MSTGDIALWILGVWFGFCAVCLVVAVIAFWLTKPTSYRDLEL